MLISAYIVCCIVGFVFLLVASYPPYNSRVNFLPLGLAFAFLSTFINALR